MNRFWSLFIQPLIETVKPARIMEVGADAGDNTRHVLEYCKATGCRADIIDPAPKERLHQVLAEFGEEFLYHPLKSLEAIPQVEAPDLALLDGDHNWYTMYHELLALQALAAAKGKAFPIMIAHDVGWPYGRRDLYYNPPDVPEAHRQPFAYSGLVPGVSELVEDGMNRQLANATHEGGPHNGVLTGIEDFVAAAPELDFTYRQLPFFNGLGILVPRERMTPELSALLDSFLGAEKLAEACMALEDHTIQLRLQFTRTQLRLERRTDALERARALLAQVRKAREGDKQALKKLRHKVKMLEGAGTASPPSDPE